MKIKKKMIALMIMAAVIMTSTVPALASIYYEKTKTFYLTTSPNQVGTLEVGGMTGSQSLKKANIKSSDSSVAKLLSISNTTYKRNDWVNTSTYSDKQGSILLTLKKPGTTTISYKIGSKTYKTKARVRKYVNPLSSLTITGINGGKNIRSIFNKVSDPSYKISKSISNIKIKAKAQDDWYFDDMRFIRGGKYGYSAMTYNNPNQTSLTLKIPKIAKNDNLQITLRNVENDGEIQLILFFN